MPTRSYDEYDIHPVPGMTAGADLSSLQYTQVGYGTTDGTVISNTDGINAVGILMNAPESGQVAKVAGPGSYCLALMDSTAVETGDYLMPDTGGVFVVATNGEVATARAHTDIAASKRGLVMVIRPRELVTATLLFD